MTVRHSVRSVLGTLLLCAALTGSARAQSYTQTWTFDQTTTGQNVSWTSPTAVFPTASIFDTSYQITKLEVKVKYLFFTLGPFDVTSQVPPDQLAGGGPIPGPAPITIFDNTITYPDPPAAPTVSAHITSGMNAGGFGTFSATNIVLGTATIDLGPPFGSQTVQLVSIRIVGSLTIHSTWFDLHQPLAGTHGAPLLVPSGPLVAGELMALELSNALPGGSAFLVVGFANLNAPLKGGILGPSPDIIIVGLPIDVSGSFTLPAIWPTGLPANFSLYFQEWFADAGGPQGFAASNTIRGVTP